MRQDELFNKALRYHNGPRPGKIGITATKPHATSHDLSLAYSPGVAAPSRAIAADPMQAYEYTAKGNLCAVISDGSAVLGLGDIGAQAAKPVMEGKAMLLKVLAGVDAFDIEVKSPSAEAFIETVAAIAPTFGAINLEDIRAPGCFEIERQLVERLDIPVMHDDQHGTAVIVAAALMNALVINKKKIGSLRAVINGAGAAAIACARFLLLLGLPREQIVMCDSRGVVHADRDDLTAEKREFATALPYRTLREAIRDADLFIGVSKANVLRPEMIERMAADPVVFALANPDPEIDREVALRTRRDLIFATGRSDWPNQVNNVLGFPYIFRGALDTAARRIDEGMKLAAARALSRLAREDARFGREYLIPDPLDARLLTTVAPAVAAAAEASGSARRTVGPAERYIEELRQRMEPVTCQ